MDGAPEDPQEERVKKLWEKLDTTNQGYLDLEGLKKGFGKIDHRESHEFFTIAGAADQIRSPPSG